MRFQIKSIILWPRDSRREPRVVAFAVGKVNVISGASRTGKSAIVPIVDYCFGSDGCAIPVGIIRDRCEWFGVLVETSEGEKLFARREPGDQSSTGDMYIDEAEHVLIPASVVKNSSVDFLKSKLNALAGLSSLDFSLASTGASLTKRAGFRDLAGFLFQAQNIVANPNVLFYKADSFEHRERLKAIIPYVLGSITPELLAKQHQLRELERQFQLAERNLKALDSADAEFRSQITALMREALELGLLSALPESNLPMPAQIDILRALTTAARPEPKVTLSGIAEVDRNFEILKTKEAETAAEVVSLRRRRHEITSLRDSTSKFRNGVAIQKGRLEISTWLASQVSDDAQCPLCGGNQSPAEADLQTFLHELSALERSAANFETVPDTLDREITRVEQDLAARLEILSAIQLEIRDIESRSQSAAKTSFTEMSAARFLGRLEANIKVVTQMAPDGELRQKVEELQSQITELRRALQEFNVAGKERAALQAVDNYAGRYIATLDAEDPGLPIRFQRSDLSLKVIRGNREDYLWELGSGSNWLSYHIAILLAFHRFFLSLDHCPVPSFLVLDQPSQVYFPKTLANRPDRDNPDPEFTDDDVEAVRKVFSTIAGAIQETHGEMQAIILDHAGEGVWEGIADVHLVEEWRGGRKLVPDDWPTV